MNDQNNNQQGIEVNKSVFGPHTGQINSPMAGGSNSPIKKNKINLKTLLIVSVVLGSFLLAIIGIKNLIDRNNQNKHITLTWWSLEEDADAVQPLIDEYQRQNPNVTITFVKQDTQDYRERLASALNSGKGPDIYEFHNSWVPMFFANLLPVTYDFSSTFYPVVSTDLKSAKGFLGVPLEYDGIALFVNQDIFNTYGKTQPKTWDAFRSLANSLTLRDQNGLIRQSGAALGVTSNVDYWQDIFALLALQNGTDLKQPSSAAGKSTLTFYTDFARTDLTWDNTLPNSSTFFGQGSLAMYFGKYRDAQNFAKNSNMHFQVYPLPQLPQSSPISYASYWVNGVSANSANGTAAWNFLRYMTQQATLRELNKNEVKVRGYGNLYPRVDMQNELLSDPLAGPFIYQASFARSWYLDDKTYDGATGINSQLALPFSNTINSLSQTVSDPTLVMSTLQGAVTQVLASFRLVNAPIATP